MRNWVIYRSHIFSVRGTFYYTNIVKFDNKLKVRLKPFVKSGNHEVVEVEEEEIKG